jgi:hypothetical protein
MNRSVVILKLLLLAGALYFLAVAIVHMLGTKVPMLFVYFNVPSYAYQDRIISFLSFGWSAFLFSAALDPLQNRHAVKAILIAGLSATFGLNVINAVTDFHTLSPDIDPSVFRMETLGLSAYVAVLIYFYFLATRRDAGQ